MNVLERVIKVIRAVDPFLIANIARHTRLSKLYWSKNEFNCVTVELRKEFEPFPLFKEAQVEDFDSVGDLVDNINVAIEIHTKLGNPKPKKSKRPVSNLATSASASDSLEFSDAWLGHQCNRYTQGLISNIELVMSMQIQPEVIDAMFLVNELPYQAARKIEISDLLHNDPRTEVKSRRETQPQEAAHVAFPDLICRSLPVRVSTDTSALLLVVLATTYS